VVPSHLTDFTGIVSQDGYFRSLCCTVGLQVLSRVVPLHITAFTGIKYKRQIFLFSLLYSWPPGTLPGGIFA
jgi:hypothetical protein